ncbi:MAG: NAD(P)/FAD-dependent oxidoreductase [Thermoanaerobaculia bacterium]|nr:NAD(P)/FAD-dependent oxidoreductase [Thermoanaerobaculia bacterium]
MKTYDAVIVGAGPAGSALAIHLARAGLDALLVEKERFPRDKVCGEMMNPRAIRHLEDLGCFSRVEALGYDKIRSGTVFLDGVLEMTGALPAVEGCVDYAHAVPRRVLDEIIFRGAQSAGAGTLEGCRIQGFEVGPDAVEIDARLEGGERLRLEARLIVGADGSESTVARLAGLAMRDDRYVGIGIRSYGEGFPLDGAILSWDREYLPGLAWVFPSKDGCFNIGVGTIAEPAKRSEMRLRDYFDRTVDLVTKLGRERGFAPRVEPPRGWALKSYGGARRNYFERGLLIGDAGSFADPLTGEGIPMALETARLAAETIQAAVAAGDFSEGRLAAYEGRWRQRYDVDSLMADALVTISRNTHLADLMMEFLRLSLRAADRDERYAETVGGVYVGIVPISQMLRPEYLLRPLTYGPETWRAILGLSRERPLADLARRAAEQTGVGLAAWRAMLRDPQRSLEWLREVNQKQMRVARGLAGAAFGAAGRDRPG